MKKISILLFIALLSSPITLNAVALNFTSASSDRVTIASNSTIDNLNNFTYIAWVYPTTSGGATEEIIAKQSTVSNGKRLRIQAGGSINLRASRATTAMNVSSGSTSTVNYVINEWNIIAGVRDGADTQNGRIYIGTATTTIREVDAYITANNGSGAATSEAGTPLYISNNGAFASSFGGGIAFVGVWNRALTLAELKAQQFFPHRTAGNVVFMFLGFNGTGTQPDWSGNGNSGTVTGAGRYVLRGLPLRSPFAF